jgi:hypothetical protein
MSETPVRNEAVTVGATSVVISPEYVNGRHVLYVRNSSTAAQVITLAFGQAAVASNGIILNVGDFFYDAISEGYVPYSGQINAISSAAGGQVSVMEW